jgi:hypothetical protein
MVVDISDTIASPPSHFPYKLEKVSPNRLSLGFAIVCCAYNSVALRDLFIAHLFVQGAITLWFFGVGLAALIRVEGSSARWSQHNL